MNIKLFIKRLLTDSCVLFSLIMLGYALVASIMHVTEDEVLLDAARVLLFYVFSLVFSSANSLRTIKALHKAVALFLHFVITVFAFYACFLLPIGMTSNSIFIGVAVYTVAYVLISAVIALFRSRFRANAEVNEDYTPQFTRSKK